MNLKKIMCLMSMIPVLLMQAQCTNSRSNCAGKSGAIPASECSAEASASGLPNEGDVTYTADQVHDLFVKEYGYDPLDAPPPMEIAGSVLPKCIGLYQTLTDRNFRWWATNYTLDGRGLCRIPSRTATDYVKKSSGNR
jgi:hypothetical protein